MKIFAGSLLFASALASQAQGAPRAVPPCDGTRAIVRLSTLKDGATMEQFTAAVEAQKNWYSSHHFTDMIFLTKVMELGPASDGAWSGKQVMTYHVIPSTGSAVNPPHDAAWDAFVKMFSDVSTIKNNTMACFPAGVSITGK